MMITKDQERRALEEIRKIVSSLGDDSYVATAFDGVFEIAESNIEGDFANSVSDLSDCISVKNRQLSGLTNEIKDLKAEVKRLSEELDTELEWKPYIDSKNVSQEDYELLTKDSTSRFLSEEEAKDLLYNWFGFAKEKVEILNTINIYEIDRHGYLRNVGTVERNPVYNTSDWYYIRFNCGGVSYELYNDEIRLFYS